MIFMNIYSIFLVSPLYTSMHVFDSQKNAMSYSYSYCFYVCLKKGEEKKKGGKPDLSIFAQS